MVKALKRHIHIYNIYVILRILSLPLAVLSPILFWVFQIILDTRVYGQAIKVDYTYIQYRVIDTSLDLLFVFGMVVSVNFFFPELIFIALGFLVWRLLGTSIYLFTKKEWILVFFPNFLEFLFIAYLIFQPEFGSREFILILVVTAIAKLTQEVLLHKLNYIDSDSKKLLHEHSGHNRKGITV